MNERYTMHQQLGEGGNGVVYKAYDEHLHRWVAIKRLCAYADTTSEEEAEELRREADLLASLRSPNIVTVHDVDSDEHGLFMVMDLLEGPDLKATIANGPMCQEDFRELAIQCLEALLTAHQQRILHRDIKPENIKIERLASGRLSAVLLDFGLARSHLEVKRQTEHHEGHVLGSIYYMAPEQLSRKPIDVRTDLYSLGVVFYEVLCGVRAFSASTTGEVVVRHMSGQVTDLSDVCPHLPAWLTAWVMRLIARLPNDRPRDVQQALEEFRAWERLAAAPVLATPWSAVQPSYTAQVYDEDFSSEDAPPAAADHAAAEAPAINEATTITPIATPLPAPTLSASAAPVAVPNKAAPQARWLSWRGLLLLLLGSVVGGLSGLAWQRFGSGPQPSVASATAAMIAAGLEATAFPSDRPLPPLADQRVLHFIAGLGMEAHIVRTPGKAGRRGLPLAFWHDLAPGAGQPLLQAFRLEPEHSPRLALWPETRGLLRAEPLAVLFEASAGLPASLSLIDQESVAEGFPFGSVTNAQQPGLTLVFVGQASATHLPCSVLRLYTEASGASLTLRVNEQRRLLVEVAQPGSASTTSLASDTSVDATLPMIAIITWDGLAKTLALHARDASGQQHHSQPMPCAPLTKPLSGLEIGRVLETSAGKPASRAQQFVGSIAECLLYSTALDEAQSKALLAQLAEHYFAKP